MLNRRTAVVALTALALAHRPVVAQSTSLTQGDRFFVVSAATSYFTNEGPHFALLRNRKVDQLTFRWERVFHAGADIAAISTFEVPVSLMTPSKSPASAECWWRTTTKREECYAVARPTQVVGGIGVTPLGIKLVLGSETRVRAFGSLAGGGVAFDRNTPVAAGSALNFAAEYQLGLDVAVTSRYEVEAAWKFQHWSNANLTYFNPGLDVNMVTVGFKRRR